MRIQSANRPASARPRPTLGERLAQGQQELDRLEQRVPALEERVQAKETLGKWGGRVALAGLSGAIASEALKQVMAVPGLATTASVATLAGGVALYCFALTSNSGNQRSLSEVRREIKQQQRLVDDLSRKYAQEQEKIRIENEAIGKELMSLLDGDPNNLEVVQVEDGLAVDDMMVQRTNYDDE